MKYAIVYLAIPFGDDDVVPITEDDAAAMGELVLRVVQTTTPITGASLIGTRLTRNNLMAPALTRLEP